MTDDPVARCGALFHVDGERIVPTDLARGPWYPDTLHGGPPTALLARTVERHDPGPASFVARLTVELLRPIPMAPLQVVARTLRPGRKVQWVEAAILADDVEVARATGLRLRTAPVDAGEIVSADVPLLPAPETLETTSLGGWDVVGYWTATEFRFIGAHAFLSPGPGAAWARLRCPVVAGEEPTPFQRVAAAADFGSGVGHPVSYETGGGINADVNVVLHRELEGDWVGLEARGWAHAHGVGMVETLIHDGRGPIGLVVQSLLMKPF